MGGFWRHWLGSAGCNSFMQGRNNFGLFGVAGPGQRELQEVGLGVEGNLGALGVAKSRATLGTGGGRGGEHSQRDSMGGNTA